MHIQAPSCAKRRKLACPNKIKTMSSLTTAAATNANTPGERYNTNSQEVAQSNRSPMSKNSSNKMETESREALGKHLDSFIKDHEEDEVLNEGKISFEPAFIFPLFIFVHHCCTRSVLHPPNSLYSGLQYIFLYWLCHQMQPMQCSMHWMNS